MRSSLKVKRSYQIGTGFRDCFVVFETSGRLLRVSKNENQSRVDTTYQVDTFARVPERPRSTHNRFDVAVTTDDGDTRIISLAASSASLKDQWLQALSDGGVQEVAWRERTGSNAARGSQRLLSPSLSQGKAASSSKASAPQV